MGECMKHKLVPVCDKVVQSRAWSSLPPVLQIFRLGEANADGLAGQLPLCLLYPIIELAFILVYFN